MTEMVAVPGIQGFSQLRDQPFHIQLNYARIIRVLEFRQLEPFIPTRSDDAIVGDALLVMRMTELEGKVGMNLPTPRADAFKKRWGLR